MMSIVKTENMICVYFYSNRDDVGAKETAQTSASVLNAERSSVLLVRARFATVVLRMNH